MEPKPPRALRTRGCQWYRLVAIIAALLIAGGVTTLSILRHLDHQYGPVQAGSSWGPESERGLIFSKDGFSYRLADRPGATARFITLLDNVGGHSVTVTAIDTDDVATDIRWSTFRAVDGGSIFGVAAPWHQFPAVIPAQGTIRLLITVHRPAECGPDSKTGGVSSLTYDGIHKVHWESLLHSHVTTVSFYGGGDSEGFRVC